MKDDIAYLLNDHRQPVHLAKDCFDTVCFQFYLWFACLTSYFIKIDRGVNDFYFFTSLFG